jgi:hypothetical protein
LLVSADRGANWRRIESLPEGAVPISIEVAPSDVGTLYIGTDRQGVFTSRDGAETWRPANEGLPRSIGAAPVTPVVNMAVDPRDSRVAFAASEVHGIFKTTDGGQQWEPANVGLPGPLYRRTYPTLIAINPENPDAMYAIIGKPVDPGRIENALYKTINGGKHWIELTGLRPNLMIRSLTINPDDPRELFIGHQEGVIKFYDDPRWDVFAAQPIREVQTLGQATECDPSKPPKGNVEKLGETGITLMEADACLFHDFNQDGKVLQFVPYEESPGKFSGYEVSYTTFPFNSQTGTRLGLIDDSSIEVPLPFSFSFYGQPQTSIFVNSNGNLTFGSGDPDPIESELKFVFKHPRIAPLWNDMNPVRTTTSAITYIANPDQFTVTWIRVPHVTPDDREFENTFQVTLFRDGKIVMRYQRVTSPSGLVGISPGGRDRFYQNFTKYFDILQGPAIQFAGDVPIGEQFVEGLHYPEVARRFYGIENILHGDEYDLLVVYGTPEFDRTITGRMRRFNNDVVSEPVSLWVKNDVAGIGRLVFDNTSFYYSSGSLRMIVNMDRLNQYSNDPLNEDYLEPFNRLIGPKSAMDMLAQMVGHAWGAYVFFDDNGIASDEILSGSERATWSFFFHTFGSQEDGNEWIESGSGRFQVRDANFRYSRLDQYLMGLLPAEQVTMKNAQGEEEEKYFLIKDPVNTGGRTRASIPELGATAQGTKRDIRIEDIMRVEGPRLPAMSSSEEPPPFKLGFILVYPAGRRPDTSNLNLDDLRGLESGSPIIKLHSFRCCFETQFHKPMTDERGNVKTGCPENNIFRGCGQE